MFHESAGSGFRSKSPYMYGYFSAAIKLPGNINTAGVAITFYVSPVHHYSL
jgi:hypothetical protein